MWCWKHGLLLVGQRSWTLACPPLNGIDGTAEPMKKWYTLTVEEKPKMIAGAIQLIHSYVVDTTLLHSVI
jgi:hypothetical protein